MLLFHPADSDLVAFLTEEIAAEKQNLRTLPEVAGFKIEQDGADLVMNKDNKAEKITIRLNVNHTVDSAVPDDGTEEAPEMKSKPSFDVHIVRGEKTLSFSCSFVPEDEAEPSSQEEQSNSQILFT